ncbi:hypothetical protein TKK_0007096 [Trichogramma kaykai]|uniref:Zinc finger CCHC domain-containing protein 7 n=1 Tax=Trichogramma kaykai TaxID=54128 RepID=A0ABD2XA02_9HYME
MKDVKPTAPALEDLNSSLITNDSESLISEDQSTNYKSIDSSDSSTYAKLPPKMTTNIEKVNYEVLLKVIPEFNGYNIPLSTFLDGLDEAFAMVTETQKPTLTRLVRSRLVGEALKAVLGENFPTLDDMKAHLRDFFAPSVSSYKLRGDMAAEYQRDNEGVVKFANRIKNLVRRIAEAENIGPNDKEATKALQEAATECFRQGLRNEIETRMEDTEGMENLVKNAIAAEREIENKRKLRGEPLAKQVNHINLKEIISCQICKEFDHTADKCPRRLLTCNGCGKSGHTHINCPNTASEICQLCQQMGHTAKNCDKNKPPKCQICEKLGHVATQCPSRVQNNQQAQNTESKAATCGRCGRQGHIANNCRLDITKKCDHCKKLGHVMSECRMLQAKNKKNSSGHLNERGPQVPQNQTAQISSDLNIAH